MSFVESSYYGASAMEYCDDNNQFEQDGFSHIAAFLSDFGETDAKSEEPVKKRKRPEQKEHSFKLPPEAHLQPEPIKPKKEAVRTNKLVNIKKKDETNYFFPIPNLYFDEALKKTSSNEFNTYAAILLQVKREDIRHQKLTSNKTLLYKNAVKDGLQIEFKAFLRNIKKLEEMGLISIKDNCVDILFDHYDVLRKGSYTTIYTEELTWCVKDLSANQIKVYFCVNRLTKGWGKKSEVLSCAQLKTWCNIKHRKTIQLAREGLVAKKAINCSVSVDNYKYEFSLYYDWKNSPPTKGVTTENKREELIDNSLKNKCIAQDKNEQHISTFEVKNEQHISTFEVKNEQHIKRVIKENIKESPMGESLKINKKQKDKLRNLLDKNFRTHHFSPEKKAEMLRDSIQELKEYGDTRFLPLLNIPPEAYLCLEHPEYGLVIDKIIERVIWRKKTNELYNQRIPEVA